jgi:hypothetical protein
MTHAGGAKPFRRDAVLAYLSRLKDPVSSEVLRDKYRDTNMGACMAHWEKRGFVERKGKDGYFVLWQITDAGRATLIKGD